MPSASRPPSARERIGGRRAVSIWLWLVGCLLTAILTITDASALVRDPAGDRTVDTLVFVAQCAVLGLVFLIADRTVLRRRRERPVGIWLVAAVSAIAGLSRNGVALALTPDAEFRLLTSPLPLAILLALSAVFSNALIGPVVAYLLATRDWYTSERSRLLELEVEAETRRLHAIGALDAVRDLAVRTADDQVHAAQVAAAGAIDGSADPLTVAESLLDAARTSMRPVGHALVAPERAVEAQRRTTIPVWMVIAGFLRNRPLPILIPLVLVIAGSTPRIALIGGSRIALAAAVMLAVGIGGVFRAARPIISRHPRFALPVTLLACVVAVVPAAMSMLVLYGAPLTAGLTPLLVITIVAVLATGLIGTATDSAEDLLESLREPVEQAELERLAMERARMDLERQLGFHVHASLQSGLVAASYALQDAIARGDEAAQAEALQGARDLLARRLDLLDGIGEEDGHIDLRTMVAREWDTIIEIEWSGPVPASANRSGILRLIREGLSNAVIHGRARHAAIAITEDAGMLMVEIADDGTGPQGVIPGLGSAVFDDVSSGVWSLERGPIDGSVLRARVLLA